MPDQHASQIPNVYVSAPAKGPRRTAPWLVGGLLLLLLLVLIVLQMSGLWEFLTPDTAADTLLLYALSSLNFIAFLVFSFIFVRNLLKLRRERRERQLGSKIKTRLIVYFISVSLLPITAMAVFSYLFFNRSLEKWFSSLPESVFQQAREVQSNEASRQQQSFRETALVAHAALSGVGEGDDLKPVLDRLTESGNLSLLLVRGGGEPQAVWSARGVEQRHLDTILSGVFSAVDTDAVQGEIAADGKIYDVARLTVGDRRELVVARERRPDPQLAELVDSSQTFENFKRRQRKVRLLGLSTLGLMTLLILFAATWSAIHLARGIATPIRALAEASAQVAQGNLTHRVSAIADDELALLAASFNEMTAQLGENRRRLEVNATELRDKNLALAERRDYIETVLESLSTGVISLDEQDRLTTINAAAKVMLRLFDIPAAGTTLTEIVHVDDGPPLERVLRRARRTGRAAWQMELGRGAAGDGAGLPVAITATALGASEQRRGVVLVIEDLSELLAAQRAAAWSEVARRMAHEIKNPLTPIQLSAERIRRNFQKLSEGENGHVADHAPANRQLRGLAGGNGLAAELAAQGEQRERVARVVEECTRTITREVAGLKAMVDEFSRFARLPRARLEAADLNEVVRQSVALYEDRLAGVRLDVLLAHSLPPSMLDAEQLRRVFVNLIDNALEATAHAASERRITVATGHDPARGLLLVEIADTGHGIARQDFSRLFQPYFSTRGRGTGLGLAIVQRIVTDHGGRVRAEATRPQGATFIIELPVTEETQRIEDRG